MELVRAVIANDEARVRVLLDAGEDVNQTDRRHMTPLLYAACGSGSKSHLIPLLIEAGADVNAVGDSGFTALFWIASYGGVAYLDLLLRNGANACHKNERGDGVLSGLEACDLAVRFQFLASLIAAGADPNNRNKHGHPDLYAPLLSRSGSTDRFHCEQIFDLLFQHNFDFHHFDDGQNMLHTAASQNAVDAARLLIEKAGLEIDSKTLDGFGNTALHLATLHHHEALIEFLIEAGADIEARNAKGQTALWMAHDLTFWQARGANINARDNQGRTVLMQCCVLDAAPRPVDTTKMSPETAARYRWEEMRYERKVEEAASKIKQLLKFGADASLHDDQGLSALDLAIETQQPALISLFH